MNIIPYRAQFTTDIYWDGNKKTLFARPLSKLLPVKKNINPTYYYTETYDRIDSYDGKGFYQVVFRIEDSAPYNIKDLILHIDCGNRAIINDLFYDAGTNLWYQRSRLIEKNGKMYFDKNDDVDSITTAGVFRVNVECQGRILKQYTSPWIYILPSSVTRDDYIQMLSDLLFLNEVLVKDNNHSIGIDKRDEVYINSQLQQESFLVNKLLLCVDKISKYPTVSLKKEMIKIPARKVKRFDRKVIKNYVESGMSGKIASFAFKQDNDDYENRIIKYVLNKILKMPIPIHDNIYDNITDINAQINLEIKKRNSLITGISNYGSEEKVRFNFVGHSPTGAVKLEIHISGLTVRTTGHSAFAEDLNDKNKKYNRLILKARNRCEQIFFLTHLVLFYDKIQKGEQPAFDIKCALYDKEVKYTYTSYNNKITTYVIGKIDEINGFLYGDFEEDNPINEEQYNLLIEGLQRKYSYIYKDVVLQNEKEQVGIRGEIKENIINKIEYSKACNALIESRNRVSDYLKNEWFTNIHNFNDNSIKIKRTAKFRNNIFYKEAYDIICKIMDVHPFISVSFDANNFGVDSTHAIYERWVFLKLLYRLSFIGFTIDSKYKQRLQEHFRDFITGRSLKDVSGYRVRIKKEGFPFEAEVGYDCIFNNNKKKRRPDIFLRLKRSPKEWHWYFFDAKYKTFSKYQNEKSFSYIKEISNVAIKKYIKDMSIILNDISSDMKNIINGSYIIMPNVDEINTSLSQNGRLYGGTTSIDYMKCCEYKDIEELPKHRYGAIVLTPSYEEELDTLIKMIFEYLESDIQKPHSQNENLKHCWACGSDDLDISEELTAGNSTKYYITCNRCKAFRVDTHCISCHRLIIKHANGNYHSYDESVESSRWAFTCPQCGSGFYSTIF